MKTKYIPSEDYYLTEHRTASGRLQLAEGRTAEESKAGLLTLHRDLATFGLPAVRTEKNLIGVCA